MPFVQVMGNHSLQLSPVPAQRILVVSLVVEYSDADVLAFMSDVVDLLGNADGLFRCDGHFDNRPDISFALGNHFGMSDRPKRS